MTNCNSPFTSLSMAAPIKLGVLGSGSGSNMQALIDAIKSGELNAEIALVMSDFEDAYILERARNEGLPTAVIDCLGFKSKFPDESQKAVGEQLKAAGVELVCLAGFMRLVKEPLLDTFPERIINIHPSLLPNYPGLMAWKQAVQDGAAESGCTVHYVDAGMDTGAIILQASVPVLEGDTAATLHARIQGQEHRIYPEAVRSFIGKQTD